MAQSPESVVCCPSTGVKPALALMRFCSGSAQGPKLGRSGDAMLVSMWYPLLKLPGSPGWMSSEPVDRLWMGSLIPLISPSSLSKRPDPRLSRRVDQDRIRYFRLLYDLVA